MSDKKYAPQERYAAKYKKQYSLPCFTTTEQDIIDKLESVDNKAGYIKFLIRADIQREKEMSKMTVSEYNFKDLEAAAFEDSTDEAVARLAEWYEKYGATFWNGECYTGTYNSREYELRPVYADEPNENDSFDVVGWELI